MQFKTIGIHRLQLSDELKRMGYQKPNSSALDEIRELGILNPAIVCPISGSDRYEILSSEETWFAAQALGIHDIPVNIVRPESETQKLKFVQIDSAEDPITKARRFHDWLNFVPQRNKTSLAILEGCTRSNISHQMRLLTLEEPIQHLLQEFQISAAHGKELLKQPAGQGRAAAAELAARHGWSVSRLKKHFSPKTDNANVQKNESDVLEKDVNTVRLEQDLTRLVGSAVTIDLKNGELKIDFNKNYEILDGIIQKLGYRQ